jgi:dimethylhistidine N-methyltransferase
MTVKSTTYNEILGEISRGLNQKIKHIPCKYFYDEMGSLLFDKICQLEEYYPTRTEVSIINNNITEITGLFDDKTLLVELGSGSSLKTKILLDNITSLAGYVPIDISQEHLLSSVEELKGLYPKLNIHPIISDFTKTFSIPSLEFSYDRIIIFYPGSTVGNFLPNEAKEFLFNIAKVCGSGTGLLIGLDLIKDIRVIERAYNDKDGITAKFNLNILERLNKDIQTNFNPRLFDHLAFFNTTESRIEMHLVSKISQLIKLNDLTIPLREGESIVTEYSYKYSIKEFKELINDRYFLDHFWQDDKEYFSLLYFRVK